MAAPEDEGSDILCITLLGSMQTGKTTFATSVVSRTSSRIPPPYQKSTRNIIRYVQIKGKEMFGIHVQDTAGAVRLSKETLEISKNQAFIVFFDWSKPDTLKVALDIVDLLKEPLNRSKKQINRPTFLVGNKRDLISAESFRSEVERLIKIARQKKFYLFSGSVTFNSFSCIAKPNTDKTMQFFTRLHDMRDSDDFRSHYTSTELIYNLKAICDMLAGDMRDEQDDKEESPLIASKASITKSDSKSWLQSVCGCCSSRDSKD